TPDDSPIGGWSGASRSMGYVFRLNYDYDRKYLAEFTGRYDGSYKFAGNVKGKRWAFFPSASVAWRLSQEDFMSDLTFINDLKVRASIGLLGNDAVSEYAFLSKYAFGNPVYLNNALASSLYTAAIANLNLSWENTLTYNFGFDFTMWNSLLGMEFDVFYNYTYDILSAMGSNYPGSMGGYFPTYANNNKTDARGFEVTVSHRNHFLAGGKPFTYSVSANVSYAKNRYLKYPDSPNIPEWQKVVGSSIDATY
ncbi:MAG: TonB-dependent receptor, partial [Muribaculaceae bacterium]